MRNLERIVNGATLTCASCGRAARLVPVHVEQARDEGHRAMPYHDPVLTDDAAGAIDAREPHATVPVVRPRAVAA